MALLVHPPVDGPRRSTRIRVRRQTNLARSSYLITHTQAAVSRRSLSRSPQDLSLSADPSTIVASLTGHPKSGLSASSPQPDSLSRRHGQQQYGRACASGGSSTAPSSSRNKQSAAKRPISSVAPRPSSVIPVLAGSKRKRSQNAADRADRLVYELVSVDKHADEEFQTPRQLRYAKRQRLLTSLSDNETPAAREPRAGPARERAGYRATTDGRLLSVTPSSASRQSDLPEDRPRPERPPTPRPKAPAQPVPDGATNSAAPPLPALSLTEQPIPIPNPDVEEILEPIICQFHRLKLPPRERRPETADTGLWKLACQERVEYLRDTYREIYEAVVQAEEQTAQRLYSQAPSTAALGSGPSSPVTPLAQSQFTLYTPSSCAAAARVDAEGDTDMDAGYSSDWDSDEDEDEEDKSEEDDGDLLFDAHAQQTHHGLLPTDGDAMHMDAGGWGPTAPAFGQGYGENGFGGTAPRMPLLASVPVYALECVPEQTARDGVPFMGRGTPVDRARRADWAAPPVPLLPRAFGFIPQQQAWGMQAQLMAPPAFYAPQPQMLYGDVSMEMGMGVNTGFDAMQIDVQAPVAVPMQVPVSMSISMPVPMSMSMPMQYAATECMPWLDPALRAESASPSPSPAPCTPPPLPLSSSNSTSTSMPPPPPQEDFAMGLPSVAPDAGVGAPSSPTGCAWHASFLQCLQSPTGCAPCFPAPVPVPFHAHASSASQTPSPAQAFVQPSQVQVGFASELAQHQLQLQPQMQLQLPVVPGSVTLGHALG